jgi:hypothetical protein
VTPLRRTERDGIRRNGNGFPSNLRDLSAKTAYTLCFLGSPLPISNPPGDASLTYWNECGKWRHGACSSTAVATHTGGRSEMLAETA